MPEGNSIDVCVLLVSSSTNTLATSLTVSLEAKSETAGNTKPITKSIDILYSLAACMPITKHCKFLLTVDNADYALLQPYILFPPGDIPSSACTTVVILIDPLLEGDEYFSIAMTTFYDLGLVSIGTPNSTRITITEANGQ